jgi:hypothetical protein
VQNIDPLYLLTPVVVLGFSFGLVLYWRLRRRFTGIVLLYSLGAYAGAIGAKVFVQALTLGPLSSASGSNPAILGAYYGAQTAAFEVGGAFLVAAVAIALARLGAPDAEGFGLGLALWENGVLIALPLLLDYVTYYLVLSHPGSSAAQTLYPALMSNSPALFYGPAAALPLIGWSILERVSSLFAHFAWGYLAVLGAVYRKRVYLAIAIPLGFLPDFLVPFAGSLGLPAFELIVFAIAATGLAVTLGVTRSVRPQYLRQTRTPPAGAGAPGGAPDRPGPP